MQINSCLTHKITYTLYFFPAPSPFSLSSSSYSFSSLNNAVSHSNFPISLLYTQFLLPSTHTHFSSLRALMKMRADLPGLMVLLENFGPLHKTSVRLLTASREMEEPSLNSSKMGMSLSDSICCFFW